MTEATPTPTARIKRIEVVGLFGLYDHVIDLNLEDRVTILHGPNGVGKTVLLQMIRALLTGQIGVLAQIPFKEFSVDFTSGDTVKVSASIESVLLPPGSRGRSRTRTTKHLMLTRGGEETATHLYYQERSSPAIGVFTSAGMGNAFIQRHAPQFPGVFWAGVEFDDFWAPGASPVRIHIVGAQRLSHRPQHDPESNESLEHAPGFPAVWDGAIDLQRRIATHLQKYGAITQELDQSFATRLIQRSEQSVPPQALKARMSAVEGQRAALQSNGVLDESSAKPFDVADLDALSQAQRDVLALVVEENETKLSVFTNLLIRITLLLRIVNSRLRNKTLRADHTAGLVVHDHRGKPLELRSLSSGEQQQIILVYDLLFRIEENTLVLIDEPELSLHVLWQKRFLPDLLEIVKVAGIEALVATHSPFIVGDRSDLMVALDAEIDHDEPLPT